MGLFSSRPRISQRQPSVLTENQIFANTDTASALIHDARAQLVIIRGRLQLDLTIETLQDIEGETNDLRTAVECGFRAILTCQAQLIALPTISAIESLERRDAQKKINYATFAVNRCIEQLRIIDGKLTQDILQKVATFQFSV